MSDVNTTAEIPLSAAIMIDGASVSVLRMRRPKVKDSLAASKVKGGDEDKELWLFATLCSVAPDDLKELDLGDYKKLQEAWKGFFI